ncbi:MAG: hypothetical protein ABJ382_13305, partial [Ilumatobacter sp.]
MSRTVRDEPATERTLRAESGELAGPASRTRGMNRLGRRFLAANLAVLGVAIMMLAIATQTMLIDNHVRTKLMWALIPAVLAAAGVAMLLARPV